MPSCEQCSGQALSKINYRVSWKPREGQTFEDTEAVLYPLPVTRSNVKSVSFRLEGRMQMHCRSASTQVPTAEPMSLCGSRIQNQT